MMKPVGDLNCKLGDDIELNIMDNEDELLIM